MQDRDSKDRSNERKTPKGRAPKSRPSTSNRSAASRLSTRNVPVIRTGSKRTDTGGTSASRTGTASKRPAGKSKVPAAKVSTSARKAQGARAQKPKVQTPKAMGPNPPLKQPDAKPKGAKMPLSEGVKTKIPDLKKTINAISGQKPPAIKTKSSRQASSDAAASEKGARNSVAEGASSSNTLFKRIAALEFKTKLKVSIVIGLVLVYFIGVIVFSNVFVPNSKLWAFDISLKTSADVESIIDSALQDYSITVSGDGFSYAVSAKDSGLVLDSKATLDAIHQDLNGWAWPLLLITGTHDETSRFTTKSGSTMVMKGLEDAIASFNEKKKPPKNASLLYDEGAKDIILVSEEGGEQLDSAAVIDATQRAMAYLQPSLTLDESYLLQPTIKVGDSRIAAAMREADALAASSITLTFGDVSAGSIEGDALASMVAFDDDVKLSLDQEKLAAWLEDFAAKTNTAGSTRSYTRDDGKQITVTGGVYGWEIDQPAACVTITDAVKRGANTVALPCLSEGEVYTKAGERDWGARYVDVDISQQYVRFYGDDGSIIWEAECITGKPDGTHDTVQGVWYVTDRESPYTLVGYIGREAEYETVVKYWMPFEGNSIGFHDATWQWAGFGGDLYAEGFGSHGCVNLSYGDAEELYKIITIRDVVVVHD